MDFPPFKRRGKGALLQQHPRISAAVKIGILKGDKGDREMRFFVYKTSEIEYFGADSDEGMFPKGYYLEIETLEDLLKLVDASKTDCLISRSGIIVRSCAGRYAIEIYDDWRE